MSTKNNSMPKRRFKEFENAPAWEQRELGEISDIIGGGTPSTTNPAYWDGDIDWYAPAEIDDTIYAKRSIRKITALGLQRSSAQLLPADRTVLFTSRAGIGKMAILQRPAATNQGFQSLVLRDGYDPYFIYSMGTKIKSKAEHVASGSTFLEISGKLLSSLIFPIPTFEEQQKIGTFFRTLDSLITLHQRKCDRFNTLKKSMLEKMFPKDGNTVPEIRFKGFTEAWEQCKLGEVAQITMGQSPNSENFTDNPNDHILVQGNADMKNGRVSPRVWTTQVTKQAEKNDLILSVRAPVGDVGKTDYDVVLGRGVAGIKGNEFIFQLLTRMKENGYWRNLSTGSTFESINSNDIKEAYVLIPNNEEQVKIGLFFSNLDYLITLHQRKLEKLQNIKKAYLSEMFPLINHE